MCASHFADVIGLIITPSDRLSENVQRDPLFSSAGACAIFFVGVVPPVGELGGIQFLRGAARPKASGRPASRVGAVQEVILSQPDKRPSNTASRTTAIPLSEHCPSVHRQLCCCVPLGFSLFGCRRDAQRVPAVQRRACSFNFTSRATVEVHQDRSTSLASA